MKFLQTRFEEYTNEVHKLNIHPKLEKYYKQFPHDFQQLGNLIFYGPSGVGKYSQMLYAIQRYSPSELKYERTLSITYEKKQYLFKISDIHYEVDMALLGCNSKLLWNDIYQQIIDILSAKTNKTIACGIIVCKNFHNIHSELLDNFYSYMQQNNQPIHHVKFILLTQEISFLPEAILNACEVIHVPRPTKKCYERFTKDKGIVLEHITNIKYLTSGTTELMQPYKITCNKILHEMTHIYELKFLKFRDLLYDLFIYHLDIHDCIWYILTNLIQTKVLHASNLSDVLLQTHNFFRFYNNNYRPIYHLESYLFYLISVIHGFRKSIPYSGNHGALQCQQNTCEKTIS